MTIYKIITTDIDIKEVTLLSVEEYQEAKEHIKPICLNWWLRSPGDTDYKAAFVNDDNNYISSEVVIKVLAIRPALVCDFHSKLEIGDMFLLNGFTWTVISDHMALSDIIAEFRGFNDDWKKNKYETSDIKKWLDKWAEKKEILKASPNKHRIRE